MNKILDSQDILPTTLIVFLFLSAFIYIHTLIFSGINHDEVEQLHVGYLILQGQLPYQDFSQNHFPAFWLITVVFAQLFPDSLNGIIALRIISGLLLIVTYCLSRRFLKPFRINNQIYLDVFLLCISFYVALELEWYLARLDVMTSFLATASLAVLLGEKITWKKSLLSGLLAGVAMVFSIKVAFISLIFLLLILRQTQLAKEPRQVLHLLLYGLALLFPLGILTLWLNSHNLLELFYQQVFFFNSQINPLKVDILSYRNSVLLFLALPGGYLYFRQTMKSGNETDFRCGIIVFGMIFFSIANSFLANHDGMYNIMMAALPIAIAILYLIIYLQQVVSDRLTAQLASITISLALLMTIGLNALTNKLYTAEVPQVIMKELLRLNATGNRKCFGIAPIHPIFCQDVSKFTLYWDMTFYELLKHQSPFLDSYSKIFRDTPKQIMKERPELVVTRVHRYMFDFLGSKNFIDKPNRQILDNFIYDNYDKIISTKKYEVFKLRPKLVPPPSKIKKIELPERL